MTETTTPIDWDDFAELHEADDGGGLLSGFKAIWQGPLRDMVGFVARLPHDERQRYVIVKSGDRRLEWLEIAELAARADFPGLSEG
jgi:hypothetical protein